MRKIHKLYQRRVDIGFKPAVNFTRSTSSLISAWGPVGRVYRECRRVLSLQGNTSIGGFPIGMIIEAVCHHPVRFSEDDGVAIHSQGLKIRKIDCFLDRKSTRLNSS